MLSSGLKGLKGDVIRSDLRDLKAIEEMYLTSVEKFDKMRLREEIKEKLKKEGMI